MKHPDSSNRALFRNRFQHDASGSFAVFARLIECIEHSNGFTYSSPSRQHDRIRSKGAKNNKIRLSRIFANTKAQAPTCSRSLTRPIVLISPRNLISPIGSLSFGPDLGPRTAHLPNQRRLRRMPAQSLRIPICEELHPIRKRGSHDTLQEPKSHRPGLQQGQTDVVRRLIRI